MEQIVFKSGGLRLEGLLTGEASNRGVVVTHPHPLYGGDMYNPVVQAIADAYAGAGYCCLRFNFRGVGASQGRFDEGRGEQADVAAALACLSGRGVGEIALAGYSFGSWVNARLAPDLAAVTHQVMVSPPVAFIDFADVGIVPGLKRVVTGSRDDIAPAGMLTPLLPAWNLDAKLDIIPGADHFYSGCLALLEKAIVSGL